MGRLARFLAVVAALGTAGCRSVGRFPGIDPGDYAYLWFNGKVSQIYPYSVPQVETSTFQALADLGFKKVDRQQRGDVVVIGAWTPDHRPTWITVRPQNAMTKLTICIGLGDELTSEALSQRVAINFGALPRTFIPVEPTLARRLDRRTVSTAPNRITIPESPPVDPLPPASAAAEPFPPIPADLLEPPPVLGPFGEAAPPRSEALAARPAESIDRQSPRDR